MQIEWNNVEDKLPIVTGRYLVRVKRQETTKTFFTQCAADYVDDAMWTFKEVLEEDAHDRRVYRKKYHFDHHSSENIIAWAEWLQPNEEESAWILKN